MGLLHVVNRWSIDVQTAPAEYPLILADVWEHLRLNALFQANLNADSGAAQPNPDRIYVDSPDGFAAGGLVWVTDDNSRAGEVVRVKSLQPTYLESYTNLTNDYTLAQNAVVYADAEDYRWVEKKIKAATTLAENNTGQALITRTYDYYQDWFDCAIDLPLPFPPISAVTGVYTTDTDNVETEYDNTKYWVDTDAKPGRIVLNYGEVWPTGLRDEKAIRVRYTAGYGNYGDVPEWITDIMLELIAFWYAEREGGSQPTERSEEPTLNNIISQFWHEAIPFRS